MKSQIRSMFRVLIMLSILFGTVSFLHAESIITKDYFPQYPGTIIFSSETGDSVSLIITDQDEEIACAKTKAGFSIEYPNSNRRFFGYDEAGNLNFYGSYSNSGSYVLAPRDPDTFQPGKILWLPAELELGATYSSSWKRYEYQKSRCWYDGIGSEELDITVVEMEDVVTPIGTFSACKLDYVSTWRNSYGTEGVSERTFWLAKDIGWVKMQYGTHTYVLNRLPPPLKPVLTLEKEGRFQIFSWNSVCWAQEYKLFGGIKNALGQYEVKDRIIPKRNIREVKISLKPGHYFAAVKALNGNEPASTNPSDDQTLSDIIPFDVP